MTNQPVTDKPYYIVGLGRSGLSTLKALQNLGIEVYGWDDTAAKRIEAEKMGFKIVDPDKLDWAPLAALILSPGIPHMLPKPHKAAHLAAHYRTPIVCDVDIFLKTLKGQKVIGITGSNGKSTTTALMEHILSSTGIESTAGGNLGIPAFEMPAISQSGTYVLELSSYQLERIITPVLSASVFLNISPNHLERHGDMARYQQAKLHIFDLLKPHGIKVIGVDDPLMEAIYKSLEDAYTIPISGEKELIKGVYVANHKLIDHLATLPKTIADLKTLPQLRGTHNYQNVAAAYAVARSLHQIEPDHIVEALKTFKSLPHRQEYVGALKQITFINDSKATTLEAAARSLGSFSTIHWIVGGQPKTDSVKLGPIISKLPNLHHVYAIGEATDKYHALLKDHLPVTKSYSLDKALDAALKNALQSNQPSTILLAPACASFDAYNNFEERGDHFKDLARQAINKYMGQK